MKRPAHLYLLFIFCFLSCNQSFYHRHHAHRDYVRIGDNEKLKEESPIEEWKQIPVEKAETNQIPERTETVDLPGYTENTQLKRTGPSTDKTPLKNNYTAVKLKSSKPLKTHQTTTRQSSVLNMFGFVLVVLAFVVMIMGLIFLMVSQFEASMLAPAVVLLWITLFASVAGMIMAAFGVGFQFRKWGYGIAALLIGLAMVIGMIILLAMIL